MTSLPASSDYDIISCHVTHLAQVNALLELKRTQNVSFRPLTATSRSLPVKGVSLPGDFRDLGVTSCPVM